MLDLQKLWTNVEVYIILNFLAFDKTTANYEDEDDDDDDTGYLITTFLDKEINSRKIQEK